MDAQERTLGTNEPSADIRVSLVLKDFDVSPAEMSSRLGMAPSSAGAKGDLAQTHSGRVTSRVYQRSFWTIQSGLSSSATYEQHVRNILDAVGPMSRRLRELEPPIVKEIYCSVIPDGALPLFQLQNETLARVAETGCGIVVDVLHIDSAEG
jgi:hypothetical protein